MPEELSFDDDEVRPIEEVFEGHSESPHSTSDSDSSSSSAISDITSEDEEQDMVDDQAVLSLGVPGDHVIFGVPESADNASVNNGQEIASSVNEMPISRRGRPRNSREWMNEEVSFKSGVKMGDLASFLLQFCQAQRVSRDAQQQLFQQVSSRMNQQFPSIYIMKSQLFQQLTVIKRYYCCEQDCNLWAEGDRTPVCNECHQPRFNDQGELLSKKVSIFLIIYCW